MCEASIRRKICLMIPIVILTAQPRQPENIVTSKDIIITKRDGTLVLFQLLGHWLQRFPHKILTSLHTGFQNDHDCSDEETFREFG